MKTCDRKFNANISWLVFLLGLLFFHAEVHSKSIVKWKWFYYDCNFLVSSQVDRLLATMEKADRAGYNGIAIKDWKWGSFNGLPSTYYANLRRFKIRADSLGLEIIPCIVGMGYGSSILRNNPNLAEGIPVKDSIFVVRGRTATLEKRQNLLTCGELELFDKHRPRGWDFVDGPGISVFQDKIIRKQGDSSVRMQDFGKGTKYRMCRLLKKVSLLPWHQYRVNVLIKTDGVDRPNRIKIAIVGSEKEELNYTYLNVKPSQEWTRHEIVFNTLQNNQVKLWIGTWEAKTGKLWLDDVRVMEAAGINLLRRAGCPVKITNIDGTKTYIEGLDYEKWVYPRLGNKRWLGDYHVSHREPPIIIKEGSSIKNGQKLLVSFYHTVVINKSQVCCCLRHKDVLRFCKKQVQQLSEYLRPRKFLINYDEVRVAGWCGLCYDESMTAGDLIAENIKHYVDVVRSVEPEAEIFTWSDMFDPYHNAVDRYYLCRGSVRNSWKGLPADITIINWNRQKRKQSLEFFKDMGLRQILSVSSDYKKNSILPTTPGVNGIMYVSWKKDYTDMEDFFADVTGW